MTTAPVTHEELRPLLFSLAYRLLGSATEAEDIVQEAYLRYQAVAPGAIQSPKAFLSTIVTRLCLNQLQSARVQAYGLRMMKARLNIRLAQGALSLRDAQGELEGMPIQGSAELHVLSPYNYAAFPQQSTLQPISQLTSIIEHASISKQEV